jgi:hypothetical protein
VTGVVHGVNLWRYAIFRPGLDPERGLFATLAEVLTDEAAGLPELTSIAGSSDALAGQLHDTPKQAANLFRLALERAGERAGINQPGQPRLVLFVDQFEELFTLANSLERAAFVAALAELAASGFVWVIATMRSDFYAQLGTVAGLPELASGERQYLLSAPRLAEIGQMIREPGAVAGISFEVNDAGIGLDAVLQEAAARESGALPLLEFALDELYRADVELHGNTRLTFASYAALGHFEGAIAARAEAVCNALDSTEQQALTGVLLSLVTAGDSGAGEYRDGGATATARLVARDEVAATPERAAVLERLVAARLVVAAGDSVRVSHEALIEHWPRLQELVRENTVILELRGRLLRERLLWDRQERTPGFLLPPGPRLREAEALLRNHGEHLDPATANFIERSLEADLQSREREIVRRRLYAAGQKVVEVARVGTGQEARGASLARLEAVCELLRAVLSVAPQKSVWQRRLCEANEVLGDALAASGTTEAAATAYRRAAEGWETLLAAAPDDPEVLHGLRGSLDKLSQLLSGAEAVPVLHRALETARRYCDLRQDDNDAEHALAAIESRCIELGIAEGRV